jgi:tRNA(Arg) A34 adenosine deaminase TadA
VISTPKRTLTDQDRHHMSQAIQLMRQAGLVDKSYGPFRAVVVRDGQVLAAFGIWRFSADRGPRRTAF